MADHTETEVFVLPKCDLCKELGKDEDAYADAKIRAGAARGQWAYLCSQHFDLSAARLGLGSGQRLILAKDPEVFKGE